MDSWYITELVLEITVEGEEKNVVHHNWHIIAADSAEGAYLKSVVVGKNAETAYLNPAGKQVTIIFRGLADLDLIYEPLEDGAEILFRYQVGLSKDAVIDLVRRKEELRAFCSPRRAEGPDYASGEIVSESLQLGFTRP